MVNKIQIDFNNINAYLFDLDDTLIETHPIFVDKMAFACEFISNAKGLNLKDVSKKIDSVIDEAFKIVAVNPKKLWDYVIESIKIEYGLNSSELAKVLEIFFSIYDEKPNVFEGSIELLEFLNNENKAVILVTHAERDWTVFKLESTGLNKYIKNIYLADVNEYKNERHWNEAGQKYNAEKEKSCIVGDSINGDILESLKAGYKNHVLINYGSKWGIYNSGKLPESVVNVKSPLELYSMIVK